LEGRVVDTNDFMECDTCRAKPGSPTLCAGCLHNRRLIGMLRANLDAAFAAMTTVRSLTAEEKADFVAALKAANPNGWWINLDTGRRESVVDVPTVVGTR
jgi:secreted protein with Ig-like and vWFA domain